MDRFIFKTVLTYPTIDEEKEIIKRFQQGFPTISNAVMDINAISNIQQLAGQIYIDEKVSEYVVRLITATRQPETLAWIICNHTFVVEHHPEQQLHLLQHQRHMHFYSDETM